jgi:hypothetical protein
MAVGEGILAALAVGATALSMTSELSQTLYHCLGHWPSDGDGCGKSEHVISHALSPLILPTKILPGSTRDACGFPIHVKEEYDRFRFLAFLFLVGTQIGLAQLLRPWYQLLLSWLEASGSTYLRRSGGTIVSKLKGKYDHFDFYHELHASCV